MNDKNFFRQVDILSSSMTSALRGWTGIQSKPAAHKPEQSLALYDIEASPYCRLVREAITELDLDVVIYPCPLNGRRFRPRAKKIGGKSQFPLLADSNTETHLYESLDIVAYLYETYGKRPLPLKWRTGALQKVSSMGSGLPRFGNGSVARASHAPQQMLELYSFEASPYARPVRELLCELELPYLLHSTGRTALMDWLPPPVRQALNITPNPDLENRKALLERAGSISIPYFVDPNTGRELANSSDILDYLHKTYAA